MIVSPKIEMVDKNTARFVMPKPRITLIVCNCINCIILRLRVSGEYPVFAHEPELGVLPVLIGVTKIPIDTLKKVL